MAIACARDMPADRLFDPRLVKCKEAESLELHSKIAGVVAAISSMPVVSSALSCLKASVVGVLDSLSSCVTAMSPVAVVGAAVAAVSVGWGVVSHLKKQRVLEAASPETKAGELRACLGEITDYDLRKAVVDLINGTEMHDDSIKIIIEHFLKARSGESDTYVKVVGNSDPMELALLLGDLDLKLSENNINVFVINRAGHYLLAVYDKIMGQMSFCNSSKAMGAFLDVPSDDMQLLIALKAASSWDGSKELEEDDLYTNHCKNQEGDTHCGFFVIQQALRFFQKGALVQDPRSYSPEEVYKQRLVLAEEIIRGPSDK